MSTQENSDISLWAYFGHAIEFLKRSEHVQTE